MLFLVPEGKEAEVSIFPTSEPTREMKEAEPVGVADCPMSKGTALRRMILVHLR